MAGQISSFLSGSSLVIRVGSTTLAYCQSLSFQQNVTVTPVGGVGSFSNHALEPVQFTAGGSMRVVRWSTEEFNTKTNAHSADTAPDNIGGTKGKINNDYVSGNGIIDKNHFNPINLLLSSTFDIDVYERGDNTSTADVLIYKLIDCRLTNYSFAFQPGALLMEDLSFVCMQVADYSPSVD